MLHPANNYRQLSIFSVIGPLRIVAEREGIAEITLPDCLPHLNSVQLSDDDSEIRGLLQQAAMQIEEYLIGKREKFNLPLALNGTSFQSAVWREIQNIPYAMTKTYGEIGQALGNGAKARAVGNAAGANLVPFLVPCHRVVGASGNLGGFSGGLSLKIFLLDMEKRWRR